MKRAVTDSQPAALIRSDTDTRINPFDVVPSLRSVCEDDLTSTAHRIITYTDKRGHSQA